MTNCESSFRGYSPRFIPDYLQEEQTHLDLDPCEHTA